jgi:cell division protein FtsB
MNLNLAAIKSAAATPNFWRRALIAWRAAVLVLLVVLIHQVQALGGSAATTSWQVSEVERDVESLSEELEAIKAEISTISRQMIFLRR